MPAKVESFHDDRRIVLTAAIPGRGLALITYNGWDRAQPQVHRGLNAEAGDSTVLFAYRKRTTKNPAMELMITAMLHRTGNTEWMAGELDPVKNIQLFDIMPSGSVTGAEITLADGTNHLVDFKDIDGEKRC